jgi:hypothetical protein
MFVGFRFKNKPTRTEDMRSYLHAAAADGIQIIQRCRFFPREGRDTITTGRNSIFKRVSLVIHKCISLLFWLRDWLELSLLSARYLNPSLLRTDELTKIIRIDHRIGREIPKKPLTVR